MTNRYLVFAGDTYYARGGGNDFIGSEPTYGIAVKRAESLLKTVRKVGFIRIAVDWSHVFDKDTGKVIKRFGTNPYGDSAEDATEENGE